ncbi:hypothetical protein JDV02_003182 [Purpureocillium takamizusanense]|uniref:Apple domain-containing protein n=1 Tax=Purpureocillium takamizusanense TaxID=2060973 RepID=A0A9Q8QDK1_9HYPO|nr:uncharacterized protein JDV02_003182 [Purpureocillium takamizusanense]UNI16777.1 hypothetical protein JDV02_003182 [Purpureocillium takamizusanense]
MQVKSLALFAVSAAAAALPAESEPYYDENTNTLSERSVKNGIFGRTTPQGQVCNADNALRNLRDARYSVSASAFCSTWIQSTVTDTAYAVATGYDTATVTPEAATITDHAVVPATVTTGTDTITVYTTIPPAGPYKRGQGAYPPWLSASYPVERVSSACSCFISAPSPAIHQTVTLTTSTQTLTNTVTAETPTTTITETSTSTTNVAATATSVVTRRCGVVGCGKITSIIEASLQYKTLADCKARCLAVPSCKAYSFGGPGTPVCTLGKVPAKDFYSELSPLFPQCKVTKLYDATCGQ